MDDWEFWAAAGGMALAVLAVLVQALRRGSAAADAPVTRGLRVYRDQLAEVARDVARGTLPEAEADRLRREIARRVLDADRRSATELQRPVSAAVPVVGLVLMVAGSVAVYQRLGAPGYPDLPIATRLSLSEQVYADRPSQDEAEAMVPAPLPPQIDPEFAALMTRLRNAVIGRPDDLRGLALLAQNEAALGDFPAARRAQEALVAAKAATAVADDHARLAEVMILAAGGRVTPEAEQALVAALQADPANGIARYYSGLLFAQIGRPDRTFALWQPLLDEGPPDAPWIAPIRASLQAVADAAGVRYALPDAVLPDPGPPGPTPDDVAAAAALSAEDRQAMIGRMVAQLADRLATEGGPAADWARLITSLAVLGRTDEARAILTEARGRFAGTPADLGLIEDAGRIAGLDR